MNEINQIIKKSTHRWLNLIDMRPESKSYGVCDREFWGWKTKDFANGTLQAGISGFLDSDIENKISDEDKIEIISACLQGSMFIQRSDGSYEEAYPLESSYCVSGLVQFSYLYSCLKYPRLFSNELKESLKITFSKTNEFIKSNKETHGVISNHLFTSELAVEMYEILFENRSSVSNRIFKLAGTIQENGWFEEYGGADAGYQSLLNYYFSAFLSVVNYQGKEELEAILVESKLFVQMSMNKAGNILDFMGARGTDSLYPSGCFFGRSEFTDNTLLSSTSLRDPLVIDIGNFVPFYNSWCFYFGMNESDKDAVKRKTNFYCEESKLLILKQEESELFVNLNNGSFYFEDGTELMQVSSFSKNNYFTQLGKANIGGNPKTGEFELELMAQEMKQEFNSPFRSSVLRVIALVIYYFGFLQRIIKKALAKFVMGSKTSPIQTGIKLKINTKAKTIVELDNPNEWKINKRGCFFHMASANYNELT